MIIHFVKNGGYCFNFIKFVEENFDAKQHRYLFFGDPPQPGDHRYNLYEDIIKNNSIETQDRLLYVNSIKNYFKAIRMIKNSDKVILHSFFPIGPLKFPLYYMGIKKSSWVIWGGDLYSYLLNEKDFKTKLKFLPRNILVKKIVEIITGIPAIHKLAENTFDINVEYSYAFYPNPVDYEILDKAKNRTDEVKKGNQMRILVGNSAGPTNNHIDIFEKLRRFKKHDIKLIVPLSYGNMDYAEKVKKVGEDFFGEKFYPLLQKLSAEKYSELLSSVDVCVMNHNRSQGMGNIRALLYLGKKVYIRSGYAHYNFFKRKGITVFDTKLISSQSFERFVHMDSEKKAKNQELIKKIYSKEVCIQSWRKIFDYQ
jgi:dTDP-N-acetylfucosamine:lipid II N-acetylfucosaminyltransferase